jgi:TRAP-type C4-dicarboxylate transport system substrate-binding protein
VGILRVQELVENHTVFTGASLYTTSFIFGMNQASYDALPADLQAVIDANSGADVSEWAGATMQEYDAGPLQQAMDRGNNIIELSEEEVQVWREAAQPTIDAWVAEMDAAGMDGTGLLAEARALIAEYSA